MFKGHFKLFNFRLFEAIWHTAQPDQVQMIDMLVVELLHQKTNLFLPQSIENPIKFSKLFIFTIIKISAFYKFSFTSSDDLDVCSSRPCCEDPGRNKVKTRLYFLQQALMLDSLYKHFPSSFLLLVQPAFRNPIHRGDGKASTRTCIVVVGCVFFTTHSHHTESLMLLVFWRRLETFPFCLLTEGYTGRGFI